MYINFILFALRNIKNIILLVIYGFTYESSSLLLDELLLNHLTTNSERKFSETS